MRWRQGFLQIWVLFTVVWALVIGAVHYNEIVNPWIGTDRGYYFVRTLADARTEPEFADLDEAALKDAVYDKHFSGMTRPQFEEAMERANRNLPEEVDEFSDRYRVLDETVERGSYKKIEIDGVPGSYLFVRSTSPKIDQRMSIVRPIAMARYEKIISEQRASALWAAFAFITIPPLVILLLGLATAWVIAGFRRRPDAPA